MSWTILGINDEVTTCECCGRAGLKKTVILSNGEGEVRYGTDCAARLLRRSSQTVRMAAEDAEAKRTRVPVYYLVRNETRGVWVGGIKPVRFETLAEAKDRIARGGFTGSIHPVYE